MRYSVPVKFIVIMLTALSLVAAFGSVLGIVTAVDYNLYTDAFDDWIHERLDDQAYSLASDLTDRYAVRALTGYSETVLRDLGYRHLYDKSVFWSNLDEDSYAYTISTADGEILHAAQQQIKNGYDFEAVCTAQYPIVVVDQAQVDSTYGQGYLYSNQEYVASYGGTVTVRYYESPEYIVSLTVDPHAFMDSYGTSLTLVRMVYELRFGFMVILAVSLMLGAVGAVYLCCAAGRKARGAEPRPAGLNRLPIDLYFAAAGVLCVLLCALAVEVMEYWIYNGEQFNPGTLGLVLLVLLVVAIAVVGFCYALAAQLKMRNFYLWKHSVIGWCCGKLLGGLRLLLKALGKLFALLPLIWQWLLVAAVMAVALILSMVIAVNSYEPGLLLLVVLGCIAVVCYGAYAFGTLLSGAKRMAQGNLNTKISTRFLVGAFADCAKHLNALADAAMVAAKKQMKSDRMKTELITNISHDIKTPLTSIINYVDLLEKPHTPQEGQQYLEVLGRQSQRMKKLIDDLMEMSKATTGNMAVDITQVDAAEAVNQALGEFADKLEAARLTPVFRQPEVPVAMLADGRLTWRVMSNLLSNIVKYALPGTRMYVDLVQLDGQVLISLKNISRAELNVSADELTERFVRGDTSRNTEGSGLGLNIAKSLMELQRGQLQLLVDGDLFKVTLIFPGVR